MDELVKRIDQPNGIVLLLLNDEPRMNSLSVEMAEQFMRHVNHVKVDSNVRVVVLAGKGKCFSTGGDISALSQKRERSQLENQRDEELFAQCFLSLIKLEVPTIAAINGNAIGSGLALALACDMRFSDLNAKLGFTYVRVGLHPSLGLTHLLPQIIGAARALELLTTGEIITAREAERIGLVNRALSKEKFEELVEHTAACISTAAPKATREIKSSLRLSPYLPLDTAVARESKLLSASYASAEFREGIRAIEEKRVPRFEDS